METIKPYDDALTVQQGNVPLRGGRFRAAKALWQRVIDVASSQPLGAMTAGTWLWASNLHHGVEQWRWQPPPGGLTFKLDGLFVKFAGLSPRGRHVHYQVLGKKGRRWMRYDQFMREATVAGFFKRAPGGELVWIEPQLAFGFDMGTGDTTVVAKFSYTPGDGARFEIIDPKDVYVR